MDDTVELTQGGIYLMRLDPAKGAEIGKRRPCAILTADRFLRRTPILFVCPLSSGSSPEFHTLHIAIPPRDRLQKPSFALAEQCRTVSRRRILSERLATLTPRELSDIIHRLGVLIEQN